MSREAPALETIAIDHRKRLVKVQDIYMTICKSALTKLAHAAGASII